MSKQLSTFFENILSNFNVDLERVIVCNTVYRYCLRNGNLRVDNNKALRALLTELSKAFDFLSHDLLIAKLHSYGLSLTSVRLLSDCLSNRKQSIKVENIFSKWENIETGVPQNQYLAHFNSTFLFVICF